MTEQIAIQLAPIPQREGGMKAVYQALANGRCTLSELRLRTGLAGQSLTAGISNGVRYGYIVKDMRFYAIAPMSVYMERSKPKPKADRKQPVERFVVRPDVKSAVIASAKKHGLTVSEEIRLSVQYRNSNLYKRNIEKKLPTLPTPEKKWWRFWQ